MKTKSEWSKLPNAIHIDCILNSIQSEEWTDAACISAASSITDTAALNQSWFKTLTLCRQDEREAIYDTYPLKFMESHRTMYVALVALIAWDDCAYLLECDAEHVKLLSALGNHAATLIYPAINILNKIKNQQKETT